MLPADTGPSHNTGSLVDAGPPPDVIAPAPASDQGI
jgi:hypothetical protein